MIVAEKIIIQEATLEDCSAVLEWWNDLVTRKMMKKNDVVKWGEHCKWFEKLLKDKNRILCVGFMGLQKIGNVRFDLQASEVYEVSINLNPLFRGMGYGPQMLMESINYLRKNRSVKKLFAKVKKINIPSRKTFAKAGFIFVKYPEYDHAGMEDFMGESEFYCELIFTKGL